MTGAEHYMAAEQLLAQSEEALAAGDSLRATILVHQAEVHMGLADVSAKVDLDLVPNPRRV